MAWQSSTDIFGRLDWINKKTKNLLGRVYALEQNTLRISDTTTTSTTTSTTTTTTLPPEPVYRVYTALLTQSGGNSEDIINTGTLIIGATYMINIDLVDAPGFDFTNVGSANNNQGTYFVATGITPNSWGSEEGNVDILAYNPGAPVVTVLENTIGNIWFTYSATGYYTINSSGAFINQKTLILNKSVPNDDPNFLMHTFQTSTIEISMSTYSLGIPSDNGLTGAPIEIRVYSGAPSFTLASTEFTSWGSGGGVTPEHTSGFTTDGSHDAGTSFYNAFNFVGSKEIEIQTFFNNNSLLTDQTAYIFNVTWGEGSSISSGKVIMGCNGGTNLLIAPINTSNNNWQTPGQSNFDIESVAGTFNFPATFSLYSPITAQGISWC